VGVETLIGATGRVVADCRPDGTVRVKGEIWRARCDEGAGMGTRVRVTGREELLLIVEPLPD
jgi:membrane-bound serine protease (ClpP class)